jgi:hypothetical protein
MDCLLTGERAKLLGEPAGDRTDIRSPSLGCDYRLTGSAEAIIQDLLPIDRLKLGTWVIDQFRLGNPLPVVSASVVQMVTVSPPLSVSKRLERVCRCLQAELVGLGDGLRWADGIYSLESSTSDEVLDNWAKLRAWTESASDRELDPLVTHLSEQGLVEVGMDLTLTIAGWQYLEELDRHSTKSDQGFVAMWFDPTMRAAYQKGIGPAIQDAGYRPMRIDAKEHNNKIDDEIIAEIRRSRFVVADFTCGLVDTEHGVTALPRGGVYYEAGFAQGLGIPVIWTCKEDHLVHVHFDTRQFNHIVWSAPEELRVKLTNRITALLGDGPHRP